MKCQCGKDLLKRSANRFYKTCGSSKCKSIARGPASNETREKLRIARLKYMEEHPEQTAWRKTNLSHPEKRFIDAISKHAGKFLIVRERSVFPYFIDFAFENEKVAVEIDGSQHLQEDRQIKDKEKDAHLIANGWRVYRIPATLVYSSPDDVIIHLMKFIGESKTFENCGIKTNKQLKEEHIIAEKSQNDVKLNLIISQIKKLNFSISSWTSEASQILNISPSCVRRWMRREMKEFYFIHCKYRSKKSNFIKN